MTCDIRQICQEDIELIAQAFAAWGKTVAQYHRYYQQQLRGERTVLLASIGREVAGYVTVLAASDYEPFRRQGVPEIADLNVLTAYQRRGIGTALIAAAEKWVAQRGGRAIGIAVDRSPLYAAAQRLYPRLGYIPDGLGINESNESHLIKDLPP